ncbi:MAG TPA: cyclase family protein [Thermomicrobiales bacterium]|nr:cyclase family protein [Thermomicrobiales bacterium]
MASNLAGLIEDLASGRVRVVDLTTPLSPETLVIGLPEVFAQSPPLTVTQISRYDDAGPAWYWNTITLGEHTGTHFDAPIHWVTGADLPDNATDTIPPEKLIAPACVLDFSAEAAADPDFLLEPEHIEAWEAEHGRIPAGSWVLFRTDWSYNAGNPQAFFNADESGPHTPGPSADAVRLLAHERDVLGFGVETVGTDAGQAANFDPPFPCHNIMHGAGKFGLASLVNLDQLPPTGSLVVAAPLKIVGGSGSPVRALALVGRD